MIHLEQNEQRLEGRWLTVDGKVVEDDTTRRIKQLVGSELAKLASANGGWDTLYVDNRDGRWWELTYPHSDWHGGGPPTLSCVSESYARSKYEF